MIIAISGMIASGKSTLAQKLHKNYKNSLLIEEFKKDDDVFNTFLKWIYEKQPNIDIGFQSYIIESLSNQFQKELANFLSSGRSLKNNHIFLDRFNVEHYIFAKVTLKQKDKKYFEAFEALFNELINPSENPDLVIFLDISFNTFKERLLQRSRGVETNNYQENEAYFKDLHANYKELFITVAKRFNIDYVIIDANNKNDKEIFLEAKKIIDNYSK